MSQSNDTQNLYRRNAGIILINEAGHIFVAERSDIKGAWQMPQGGMDDGEDTLSAARRELEEETSLKATDVELIAIHPEWLNYDFLQKEKDDPCIGQTQKWFLFKLKADESHIDVIGAKDAEFSDWKWISAEEILDVVWDVRKPIYEEVFKYFNKYLSDIPVDEDFNIDDDVLALVKEEDEDIIDDEDQASSL